MSDDASVVRSCARFLGLMSAITHPADVHFRSYASDGVEGLAWLCDHAQQVATAERGALASLVIDAGHASSFALDGAHARATLRHRPAQTPEPRLLLILALTIGVIVAIFLCLGRR